jgi:hypothetical protein
MSGIDVPLDAPIPTADALYFWCESEGAWVTPTAYYFLLARRTPAGERAAVDRRDRPAAARQQTFSNYWRNPYASRT